MLLSSGGRLSLGFLLSFELAQALSFHTQCYYLRTTYSLPSKRIFMLSPVQKLLLVRYGLLDVAPAGERLDKTLIEAAEIELAALGYVLSYKSRDRLQTLDVNALTQLILSLCKTLNEAAGGSVQHRPLFRSFPRGIPADTYKLWSQKVLTHYLQAEDQPCLFCGHHDTVHVLNPCQHIVCDYCFDGSNYSACPVCEHHVDLSSPFFKDLHLERPASKQKTIRFKWLDLQDDEMACARRLFVSLCERRQAMSPNDVQAFKTLIDAYGFTVLEWLPAEIPLRENIAWLFGTLLQRNSATEVLQAAEPYLTTATDFLRLLAAFSNASPALLPALVTMDVRKVSPERLSKRWQLYQQQYPQVRFLPAEVKRFKMAPLPRLLRRELLSRLECLPQESMVEDMLRHASFWVWVGEFLHPFEYVKRFPRVATAFALVRQSATPLAKHLYSALDLPRYRHDPKGKVRFISFNAEVEQHINTQDLPALCRLLATRPGELARRLDHLLRMETQQGSSGIQALFCSKLPLLATPVLLTLASSLAHRDQCWPVRVYFPKGAQFLAPATADRRIPLPPEMTLPLVTAIEQELLQRFAQQPDFQTAFIDEALRDIMVPFNERTASSLAIDLPRGSSLSVPSGSLIRLFTHWCQPPQGYSTDLDLAVAFFDKDWNFVNECTYYHLSCDIEGKKVAIHSGDYQDAPYPDGASEFIDLHREAAMNSGIRYAVMQIHKYSGLPFSGLERGFAGIMLRDPVDSDDSSVFDPRTVEHKFQLAGETGTFVPLVLDVEENRIFWLDASNQGGFAYNNVANSQTALQRICADVMSYFGMGIRPTMFQLTVLHAAARTRQVWIRGQNTVLYTRNDDESPWNFYQRILQGSGSTAYATQPDFKEPMLAAVLEGNFNLPPESVGYALMRGKWHDAIRASDWLS